MTVTAMTAGRQPCPGASWNKTADEMGRWDGGVYAQRLYRYGAGPNGAMGQRKLAIGDWSVHVFDARLQPPSHLRRLYQTLWAQKLYGEGGQLHGVSVGDRIPWSGAWTAPTGTDRNIIVEWLPLPTEDGKWTWEGCDTPETMRTLYLFAPYDHPYNGSDLFGINSRNGYYQTDPAYMMVAASGGISIGLYGDGWTNAQERGNGTLNRIGIVLGEELLDGEVAHAQALTIANTAFAPLAAKPGIEGQDYFGPATRFEWATETVALRSPGADTDPEHQTPHGYRAVLKKSVDIEQRVDLALKYLRARGVKTGDTVRRGVTALFVGKQTHGEIVGETSGSGMWVETDGWKGSKAARTAWASLGVTRDTLPAWERVTSAVFGEDDWEAVRPSEPGR